MPGTQWVLRGYSESGDGGCSHRDDAEAQSILTAASTPSALSQVMGPVEFPMEKNALMHEAQKGGFWSYACGVASKVVSMFDVAGLEIDNYRTTLPVKKGLSSSAALCVMVARAFSRAYGLGVSIRGEMELAYQGEILTPSQCGRMDQACAYGPCPVVLHYDGEAVEVEELVVGAPLHLVVADLHASKDTVIILEKLRECFPHPRNETEEGVVRLLGEVNKRIVGDALRFIAEGKVEELGRLMGDAQAEFDRYGGAACPEQLTAPVLHKVRQTSRRADYAPSLPKLPSPHASFCCGKWQRLICATTARTQVLAHPSLQPHVFGGKGVGSQGDGTVQFLCRCALLGWSLHYGERAVIPCIAPSPLVPLLCCSTLSGAALAHPLYLLSQGHRGAGGGPKDLRRGVEAARAHTHYPIVAAG